MHEADVVVVGGGPAGAAAAARLAGRGLRTVLVDRASFPRDKVCGDFVGPSALAELAGLGVDEVDATSPMAEIALHVDADRPAVLRVPQVGALPGYGRVIPRLTLDAWIVAAARRAGADVLQRRKVTAVQRAPDGVTVRGDATDGPWELRARLLLGADGSNSLVARTLHGGTPAHQNRITAVRAYFDGVGGPDGQGDVCFRSDGFPGYFWLFPSGDGAANVGTGMFVSTYPQTSRNLRELLLRVTEQDRLVRDRLRGARMRGKVLGHPLTTYDPRLPLVGDRVMLLGDAAGLINPLNGEGIQYALHSGRWAADVAAGCLASDRLDAAGLAGYERVVRDNLRADMALSRLIVQLFRNRRLNRVWLGALRSIAGRCEADPQYAYRVGCVLCGLPSADSSVGNGAAAGIFARAMVSRRGRGPGDRGAVARGGSGEFAGWAGGTGRALADFAATLTRSGVARGSRPYPASRSR